MSKRRSIAGWPVMKSCCATCPFGPKGDGELAGRVLERTLLKASQICHHPVTHGKKETHLCRGARDIQLRLLAAMGLLPEPTDEAFAIKSASFTIETKGHKNA